MSETVIIERRFCGPPESGNGGYVCGLVANRIDGAAEVTLRVPPPMDTPLTFATGPDDRIELRDGDLIVATGTPAEFNIDPPAPPTFAEAAEASKRYAGFDRHVFPTCFVCGPDRTPDDGLCLYPGEIDGRGYVAATWTPHASLANGADEIAPEILWAALDCPGGFAWGVAQDETPSVLGRMAARLIRMPAVGERCVALGWRLEEEGRKRYAGTAVFTEAGELCGLSRQTWIQLRPRIRS